MRAVAVVAGLLAALCVFYTLDTGDTHRGLGTLWPFLGVAVAATLLRWRASRKWQGRFLYALFVVVAVELLLQVAAAVVRLPINTYEHVPYGRIYWTQEGFCRGVMNRHGWHAPTFPDEARVVLIGDSFVQALQVPVEETVGARLAEALDTDVVALGRSAIGPAHYLELVRYACARFKPRDIVLVLFAGNDLSDLDPKLRGRDPERYLYLELADGGLRVLPGSEPALERFRATLAFNDRPAVLSLPLILRSHWLTPKLLKSLRRRAPKANADPFAGLDRAVLENPPDDLVRLAEAILDECRAEAARHGATLRLATVPFFPPTATKLEAFEQRVRAFAGRRNIPTISLRDSMRAKSAEPSAFYFGGSGHFTPAGHALLADALAQSMR